MEDVLMEIVKDRVDEKVQKAEKEKEQETRQETTVTHINDIMKNLKLTVEQAMDALSIPQSQRSIYAGLVGKKTQ